MTIAYAFEFIYTIFIEQTEYYLNLFVFLPKMPMSRTPETLSVEVNHAPRGVSQESWAFYSPKLGFVYDTCLKGSLIKSHLSDSNMVFGKTFKL